MATNLHSTTLQKKMKRPGTRNMSMYDGGKPTAVKTLGTQIASIYEGKVGTHGREAGREGGRWGGREFVRMIVWMNPTARASPCQASVIDSSSCVYNLVSILLTYFFSPYFSY